MSKNKTIGWGLFLPKASDHGIVHPKDEVKYQEHKMNSPRSLVYELRGYDGDYVILGYGFEEFRLRSLYFRPVAALSIRLGDIVRTKTRTSRIGQIYKIMWHYKRGEPMYFLKEGNKRLSRRYWESDLEAYPTENDD